MEKEKMNEKELEKIKSNEILTKRIFILFNIFISIVVCILAVYGFVALILIMPIFIKVIIGVLFCLFAFMALSLIVYNVFNNTEQ